MALSWPEATAAPWTHDDGALYARASVAQEQIEGLSAWRADLYAEYGLSDTLTLSLKTEAVAFESGAEDFDTQGWRATLRQRIFQSDTFNLTLEGGVLKGGAIGGTNGCETLGIEVRGGASWSGDLWDHQTFTFAEAVQREHERCRRTRYEAGFGQEIVDNLWSVTQVWIQRGPQRGDSNKTQTEMMWRREHADYSVGYRREYGGNFREESIFLAVAKRF